jgi:hypothetical protein
MRSIVRLPAGARSPLRVFVNGVAQVEGRDYRLHGDELIFNRHLTKEGKLGIGRWTAMFLGLFGTYRQNDSVDVHWSAEGRDHVAVGLDIEAAD